MTSPNLNSAARRHIRRMLGALEPHAVRMDRQFRAILSRKSLPCKTYDAQRIRAFLAISPEAAARQRSTTAFLENAQEQCRRLAKLNVSPAEAIDMLREADALARAELDGRYAPAREQLLLATTMVLNHAYYQVRESETQAFFGLSRAEIEARGLDDLLRSVVRILVRGLRAVSGRLLLMDRIPRALARPRVIDACWSYPLRGAGVLQLSFRRPQVWLPRDLALLEAASERCSEAIAYRRLEAQRRQAEENERRRIGRELHDEAGQSLVSLRLELEMIEQRAAGALRESLRAARATADKAVEELRRIVAALSPAVLERLGLDAALRQLAARMERTHGFDVRVRLARVGKLRPEIQQAIYRVAQECLQNAAKHSKATRVNLCLQESDRAIRLSVTDNGTGFEVKTAKGKPLSFGLPGMRERAELFGGSLTLRSAPGKGAAIVLRLPRQTAG